MGGVYLLIMAYADAIHLDVLVQSQSRGVSMASFSDGVFICNFNFLTSINILIWICEGFCGILKSLA